MKAMDFDDIKVLRKNLRAIGLDNHRAKTFAGMMATKDINTTRAVVNGLKRLGFHVDFTDVKDDGDFFTDVTVTGNGHTFFLGTL